MIGEKNQALSFFFVPYLHPAQRIGTFLPGSACSEKDALVFKNAAIVRYLTLLYHRVKGIVLHAGDKINFLFGPLRKQSVVIVAPVIDHHRARFERQTPSDLHVMDFALGDHPKAGQITVMVEQEVKLNGPFGAAKLRPVKNTDAQVDHRGVQTDQLVFKAELLFEKEPLCGSAPAIERKVSGTVPRIDVRWRRPKKNDEVLYQPPNARVSLRNSKARGKSHATSGHAPTGRTSSRQTDPSS